MIKTLNLSFEQRVFREMEKEKAKIQGRITSRLSWEKFIVLRVLRYLPHAHKKRVLHKKL